MCDSLQNIPPGQFDERLCLKYFNGFYIDDNEDVKILFIRMTFALQYLLGCFSIFFILKGPNDGGSNHPTRLYK